MHCFNPRPRRGAGATIIAAIIATWAYLFQSSPAPRRGRYFSVKKLLESKIVSILARAEARALPTVAIKTPPLSTVSILARAEARALQGMASQQYDTETNVTNLSTLQYAAVVVP